MTDCAVHTWALVLCTSTTSSHFRDALNLRRERRCRRPGTVVARLLIFGFEIPSQEPKHPRAGKHGQG